jgi:UDP-N-acetylglucosamine 2-epimerase (non-hydrolysing)
MKRILIIFGTRPEIIKLAPVILEFQNHTNDFSITVCNTGQQKELSYQTLDYFGIHPDINLDVMEYNQSLITLQAKIMNHLHTLGNQINFDAVIVQGDTMSAFCGALFGALSKIHVFHIEAGLRSYNLSEPFPEEALRQMISRISSLNFAPTQTDKEALLKENVPQASICVTGNTVIDALHCLPESTLESAQKYFYDKKVQVDDKVVLITIHRRENQGANLDLIIDAIQEISEKYYDHTIIIPVHPNPNVGDKFKSRLSHISNILLEEPLSYPNLVYLMENAKLIITDSGGIQEEAPSFGCPVLVARNETERNEGIRVGAAKLVGNKTNVIVEEASKILNMPKDLSRLKNIKNPYGDGDSSIKIINHIKSLYDISV